jgi:diphthine synthase
MADLYLIGLGLQDDLGISRRALEAARVCDRLFLESYTSILPGLDRARLENAVGTKVEVLDRTQVEDGSAIIEAATAGRAALLVPGDPMTATTHLDLRLRAHAAGIPTRVFHGASILTAAAGILGLHVYKFGPVTTIPRPGPSFRPTSPYERLAQNHELGLHTLALLDTAEGENPLTAPEGLGYLRQLEEEQHRGACLDDTLACVVARAGSETPAVAAGHVGELQGGDFGPTPHVVVLPGDLHFTEVDALQAFAGLPADSRTEP